VVAVDDAQAVARDASGPPGDTGNSGHVTQNTTELVLARLDTMTEQITQRVAASVSALIEAQVNKRLAEAGVATHQLQSKK
jgi:hypothetical protein